MTEDMQQMHDLAALYVVDALTPDEARGYEEHLAGCAECQQEVAALRSVTERLTRSVQADPPARLRSSVLELIGTTPQQPAASAPNAETPTQGPGDRTASPIRPQPRRTWIPYLVAAAAVLLAIGFGVWGLQSHRDAQQATDQRSQIMQVLGSPDLRTATASGPSGSSGTVVLSDKQGKALFVGRQLPSLESGKVYELWTINQSVVPAGTFTPTTQTSLVSLPDAALDASKIAVSVEPTGGSPQPTTTPIMVLSVPPAS